MWATASRMALAPIIMLILVQPGEWAYWTSAVLFVLGSATDWLDGYWARKYNSQSVLGQLMDPIADKILVLGPLLMMLSIGRVDAVMVFLLISRDIFIAGIRSAAANQKIIIAAGPLGKWKTAIQMVSVTALLIYQPLLSVPVAEIGYYGLWLSVIFSLASAAQYTWNFARHSPSPSTRPL